MIERLDAAVRAVCPEIDGVSIGRKTDRSTWAVQFRPEATEDQQRAAQAVINGFPDILQEELLADLADLRWRTETGGIILPNGVPVATDDGSQRKIAELRRRAEMGEIALPFGFKHRAGWVDLGLDALIAIDRAVCAHVEACYDVERTVADDITSGLIDNIDAVKKRFLDLLRVR